jgi:hypothetical protein
MSQLADSPPGLRERKKIRLRRTVQREALAPATGPTTTVPKTWSSW